MTTVRYLQLAAVLPALNKSGSIAQVVADVSFFADIVVVETTALLTALASWHA